MPPRGQKNGSRHACVSIHHVRADHCFAPLHHGVLCNAGHLCVGRRRIGRGRRLGRTQPVGKHVVELRSCMSAKQRTVCRVPGPCVRCGAGRHGEYAGRIDVEASVCCTPHASWPAGGARSRDSARRTSARVRARHSATHACYGPWAPCAHRARRAGMPQRPRTHRLRRRSSSGRTKPSVSRRASRRCAAASAGLASRRRRAAVRRPCLPSSYTVCRRRRGVPDRCSSSSMPWPWPSRRPRRCGAFCRTSASSWNRAQSTRRQASLTSPSRRYSPSAAPTGSRSTTRRGSSA